MFRRPMGPGDVCDIRDICSNCNAIYYPKIHGENRDKRPVVGCNFELDATKLGEARRKDVLDQEVNLRKAGLWNGS